MRHFVRQYASIVAFGLAFGFATAVTLLLFANAAATLRGVVTTDIHQVRHVAPAEDADVMYVNADPWAWTDAPRWQHRHWHWGHWNSLEARIRAQVGREIEAAFDKLPDIDIDVDADDDNDDTPPTPPAPPSAVAPTTTPVVVRTR